MIVVTGAHGLVGSAVSRMFLSRGERVAGIDNDMRAVFFGSESSTSATGRALAWHDRYVHFAVDIRDADAVFRVLDRITAVVHCAAQPSHDWAASDPLTDFGVNALGTVRVLEAARRYCSDAPFVFLSTNKVYGDRPNQLPLAEGETRWTIDAAHKYAAGISEDMPIDGCMHSVFGASKVAADVMVQEYGRYFGMKTVCFRGGCLTGGAHAGAEQHGFLAYLVKCCREGRPYTVYGYGGKQVRDNIHAEDVATAIGCFVDSPFCGEVYNLGGGVGNSVSVNEAIAHAERITGNKMDVRYVDAARKGDHKWYITDMRKFANDYPEWQMRWSLQDIFEELCNGTTRQTGDAYSDTQSAWFVAREGTRGRTRGKRAAC